MNPYEIRVLIFGGIYDGHLSDDVVAYSRFGWSKIGKLKTINFQMTAIEVNGRDILVFGGSGDIMSIEKHTEVWRVSTFLMGHNFMRTNYLAYTGRRQTWNI